MRTLTALALAGSLMLTGCALPTGGTDRTVILYDLGVVPVAAQASAAPRPSIALTEVQAPAWLEGQNIYYRLVFADALQPRPYAQARWVAAPSQMVAQRARLRLAQFANVLAAGDTTQELVLKLELDEFAQVFDASDSSRVVMQLRATLLNNGRLVAQRSFVQARPAPTPNAAGGVRALAAATDTALDELAVWVGEQTRAVRPR